MVFAPRLLRDQVEKVGVRDCVREPGRPRMKRQTPHLLRIHRWKWGGGGGGSLLEFRSNQDPQSCSLGQFTSTGNCLLWQETGDSHSPPGGASLEPQSRGLASSLSCIHMEGGERSLGQRGSSSSLSSCAVVSWELTRQGEIRHFRATSCAPSVPAWKTFTGEGSPPQQGCEQPCSISGGNASPGKRNSSLKKGAGATAALPPQSPDPARPSP